MLSEIQHKSKLASAALTFTLVCMMLVFTAGFASAQSKQDPQKGLATDKEPDQDSSVETDGNNVPSRVKFITGTARRIKFEFEIPEISIENPDVITVAPISATEILVTGLKAGTSTLVVFKSNGESEERTITVEQDLRKLSLALRNYFPDCDLKVRGIGEDALVLSGTCDSLEQHENILTIVKDFVSEKIVNELRVFETTVEVKAKVYQISNKRLGESQIDWKDAGFEGNFKTVSDIGKTLTKPNSSGATKDTQKTIAFLEALEKNDIAKLLDQPVLIGDPHYPSYIPPAIEMISPEDGNMLLEFFGTKIQMAPLVYERGVQLMTRTTLTNEWRFGV